MSFLVWMLIGLVWIEGGEPPIAVLVGAIGLLFLSVNEDLTNNAKDSITVEQ
jgi:hypothetical protein